MFELLATTGLLSPLFFFFLLCFDKFIIVKIFTITVQFILCIILLTNNFYKKHFLWKRMKYEEIHELNFYPVYEIYPINNSSGFLDHLVVNSLKDKKFSIIKTEQFSKKCLDNYYINSENECPITQIYIEYEKSSLYNSFHELIIKEP